MPDIEERLAKLETRHEPGGLCERNRDELRREVNMLRERMISLETKLFVGGTALSIIGPIVAQWIMSILTKKV